MVNKIKLIIVVAVLLGLASTQADAADEKVTLKLGGRFCGYYPKEITEALTGVKGVEGVDLKSMKDHAVVTHDGSVKPESLVEAMKGVKGTKLGIEWYCTAEVVQESGK
jgi:mercuric ion binding protein